MKLTRRSCTESDLFFYARFPNLLSRYFMLMRCILYYDQVSKFKSTERPFLDSQERMRILKTFLVSKSAMVLSRIDEIS
jgi:hypothetical protein